MGRQRGGSSRQATQRIGRERSWGLVIAVAVVVAVLGAFVVVVVLDARQKAASGPRMESRPSTLARVASTPKEP